MSQSKITLADVVKYVKDSGEFEWEGCGTCKHDDNPEVCKYCGWNSVKSHDLNVLYERHPVLKFMDEFGETE